VADGKVYTEHVITAFTQGMSNFDITHIFFEKGNSISMFLYNYNNTANKNAGAFEV